MKRHASCFKGTDAVAWLVAQRVVGSQEEAVLLGNDMLRAGLLHHVTYRHLFANKDHLYRCMPRCCQVHDHALRHETIYR